MWQLKPVCPQINAARGASKRALALGKQATYCVYAIVDPSCPDSRFKGGRPIYVGRTDDLYQRIRNHVGAAKRANPNGIGIAATLRMLATSPCSNTSPVAAARLNLTSGRQSGLSA